MKTDKNWQKFRRRNHQLSGRLYLAHPGPLPAGEWGGVGGGEGEGAAGGAPTRPLLLLSVQRQPAPPYHVFKVVITSQFKKRNIRVIKVPHMRWHLVNGDVDYLLIADPVPPFSAPCGAGSFNRLDSGFSKTKIHKNTRKTKFKPEVFLTLILSFPIPE